MTSRCWGNGFYTQIRADLIRLVSEQGANGQSIASTNSIVAKSE